MKQTVWAAAALFLAVSLAGCTPKSLETQAADGGKQEPAPNQTIEPDRNQPQPTADAGKGSGAEPTQNANSGAKADPKQPVSSVTVSSGNQVGLPISNDAYRITKVSRLASAKVIEVSGQLRAFEAVGAFTVKGSDGKVIKLPSGAEEGVVHAAKGAPEWGDFTVQIPLPQNVRDNKLLLEFFVHSAKDGSRQQMLSFTVSYN